MTVKTMFRRTSFAAALICFAGAASAGAPQFHRHDNSGDRDREDHYKDQGDHPREASVPGVTLQSRALLDKAGITHFELSTGKLDSSVVPTGNIEEVKIRLVQNEKGGERRHGEEDEKGEHQKGGRWEFEHLRGGGYFHTTLPGLTHNQVLAVKAEVSLPRAGRGDDEREVELKLLDPVRYLPDLAAQKLDFPPTARPGTQVVFAATLAELMGDVGGHGDCVLVVDGKPVDSARGIWIDAGGVVTCRLGYSFSKTGLHKVAVRIDGVLPADYDLSNNEIGGQIQIDSPSAPIFYWASAFDSVTVTQNVTDYYASSSATVPDEHHVESSTLNLQGRYFYGQIPSALNLPIRNVAYADSSGGSALSSVAFANLPADSTGPSDDPAYTTVSAIQRYDAASAGWLMMWIYKNTATGAGVTLVDWTWDAGDVTYHSENSCTPSISGYRCTAGNYTRNSPPTIIGPRVALGANYSANVVADDGTQYAAQPAMAILSVPTSTSSPASCQFAPLGGPGPGKICTSSSSTTTSRSGTDTRVQ